MARPIFIIRVPPSLNISQEDLSDVVKSLEEKLDHEYHVITFSSPLDEEVVFECFNCKNAPDIEIEKLKKNVEVLKKIRRPEDII